MSAMADIAVPQKPSMPDETISNFLAYLRDCVEQYHLSIDAKTEAEKRTQDILHDLELNDHTYNETAKLAKELRTVRQERRCAKDTGELLEPVVLYVNGNQAAIKTLERLLGEVRKVRAGHTNRYYIPKSKGVAHSA